MWRRTEDDRRHEKARTGLRHERAKKRARRRLGTAPTSAGPVRRLGWAVFESWWLVQESFLWPASDRLRATGEKLSWQLEDLAWAARRRVAWPVRDRFEVGDGRAGAGRNQGRFAVAGLGATVAVALIAGALTAGGSDSVTANAEVEPSPEGPSLATVTEEPRPAIVERTEELPDGPVLSGARPQFEAAPAEEVERARRIIEDRETEANRNGTEDSPDREPAGDEEAETARLTQEGLEPTHFAAERSVTPREEARRVAQRFSRVFIAYELGGESEIIREVFRETAGARLVEELESRPPRLPRDGHVPRAEIVNVVDGPREGRKLEVSVSLLRVESLAELRLDLFRTEQGWRVGAVKG